ncbi:MAG: hypothetical protein LBH49_01900 [Puniceicoccales bacterium]|jgi:hypothetical protein|nr:hypothetical protein [Puniceicoccales bacterium]
MQNFSEQCLDLARSILNHNLGAISEDGKILPYGDESNVVDEQVIAALALGEYYRLTQEKVFNGFHLIELAAKCISFVVMAGEMSTRSLGYLGIALLSFGSVRSRNPVWEKLPEEVQNVICKALLTRRDNGGNSTAFSLAVAVAKYSLGMTKRDDTGKLVDRFLENLSSTTGKFFDNANGQGLGGCFDVNGLFVFSFIRQVLHMHTDFSVLGKKLPSLRSYADKYLKLLPDLIRCDGVCWSFGSAVGAYTQMYCVNMVMQALRDGWIPQEKQSSSVLMLRSLFYNFFLHYIDQENGFVVVRDGERNSPAWQTTRNANFDAVRYLCQWAGLAKKTNLTFEQSDTGELKNICRYVSFDKTLKKEQGLFIYRNQKTGVNFQLPLISGGGSKSSDALAFPHCPGVFDWPVDVYLPILQPEITIDRKRFLPSFYGKKCVSGMGSGGSMTFSYEQPDLITVDEEIVPGLASFRVQWTFWENRVLSEFIFTPKTKLRIDGLRYVVAISSPHTALGINNLALGEEGLKIEIKDDDFLVNWKDVAVVSDDPLYRTFSGKIHYLQTLARDNFMIMQAGRPYKLSIRLSPQVIKI